MNENIIFNYNKELHECICTINYNGILFTGKAKCHPEDYDMENNLTGQEIASKRAAIKLSKFIKNHEIKYELNVIKKLYNEMRSSKKFNEQSFESKKIQATIHNLEKQLATANQDLATLQQNLKEYLQKKDEFYKQVRRHRWIEEQNKKYLNPPQKKKPRKKKPRKKKLVRNKK